MSGLSNLLILEKPRCLLTADGTGSKIKVGKINVDDNPEIAQKYRVMSIPMFGFFKNGQLEDSVIGAVPKANLEEKIKALILEIQVKRVILLADKVFVFDEDKEEKQNKKTKSEADMIKSGDTGMISDIQIEDPFVFLNASEREQYMKQMHKESMDKQAHKDFEEDERRPDREDDFEEEPEQEEESLEEDGYEDEEDSDLKEGKKKSLFDRFRRVHEESDEFEDDDDDEYDEDRERDYSKDNEDGYADDRDYDEEDEDEEDGDDDDSPSSNKLIRIMSTLTGLLILIVIIFIVKICIK